ncbi:MAG: DUF4286 family protein [Bacteroidota bacterium]
MIVYNVTTKIDREVEEDWLQWMQDKHIPDVLATGYFESYQMFRIIKDEPDGSTYATQYHCKDMPSLHAYISKCSAALKEDHQKRYKDRYVCIRTLMETIEKPAQ